MNKFKVFLSAAVVLLSSCSMLNMPEKHDDGDLPYTFAQFSDIPVPENSSMDLDKTRIFGRESHWIGTVTFTSPYSVSGVFDFYMSEMKKFGWSEITSVRGPSSVMTYSRDFRIAVIQLTPSNFKGTEIILTISPAPRPKRQNKDNKSAAGAETVKREAVAPAKKQDDSMISAVAAVPSTTSTTAGISSVSAAPLPAAKKKSLPGSLGLGDASNINYKSNSNGVGKPPVF